MKAQETQKGGVQMSNVQTTEVTPIPGVAQGTWQIDPAHSTIAAVARHMMITKVRGYFHTFSGAVHVGPTLEETSAEASIDTTSIDTRQDMRDNHLKSPDFLDVENHPSIDFRSTAIEEAGDGRYRVTGDLTIRGVTKPIVLDAEFGGVNVNPFGKTVAFVSAEADLDRESYGMTWNQAIESGGVLVSKRFKLELDLQLVKQEAQIV
jgi:polyisoprenoid-binding protein YceI